MEHAPAHPAAAHHRRTVAADPFSLSLHEEKTCRGGTGRGPEHERNERAASTDIAHVGMTGIRHWQLGPCSLLEKRQRHFVVAWTHFGAGSWHAGKEEGRTHRLRGDGGLRGGLPGAHRHVAAVVWDAGEAVELQEEGARAGPQWAAADANTGEGWRGRGAGGAKGTPVRRHGIAGAPAVGRSLCCRALLRERPREAPQLPADAALEIRNLHCSPAPSLLVGPLLLVLVLVRVGLGVRGGEGV